MAAIIAGWLIWSVALDPHVYVTGCHTISLNGESVEVSSGSGSIVTLRGEKKVEEKKFEVFSGSGSYEFWTRGFSYSYIVDITPDSKGCIETAKGRRGERRDPYP